MGFVGKTWSIFRRHGHEILKLTSGVTQSTMIIASDLSSGVMLVKKHCEAVEDDVLVLPGGKVEVNEITNEAASREFEEETGYRVDDLTQLSELYVFPGYVEAKTVCFVGKLGKRGNRGGDDLDKVTPKMFTTKELGDCIKLGKLKDPRTVAFLSIYLAKMDDIRAKV